MTGRAPRNGFTTGSAATAATVAALLRILGEKVPEQISIPPPPGAASADRLIIPVAGIAGEPGALTARAVVIKDGGDDPDVTHKARIEAHVRLHPDPDAPAVRLALEGGTGVGRVTLPGLPVPVGEAAINPGPRAQIALAVNEVCAARLVRGTLAVVINVPEGERLARPTLNARMGVVGGISILGTQGTTRPFSHEAWQGAIVRALEVAEAMDIRCLGLSSGRRSESLLMARYPDLPPQAFIQAADFIGFAVGRASSRSFVSLVWGCFFGKLLKMAQGHAFTHARSGAPDLVELAALCARRGLDPGRAAAVASANTAAQALELMLADARAPAILAELVRLARCRLEQCAHGPGRTPLIGIRLFHLDGRELARSEGTDPQHRR